jgi:hypothetical protein
MHDSEKKWPSVIESPTKSHPPCSTRSLTISSCFSSLSPSHPSSFPTSHLYDCAAGNLSHCPSVSAARCQSNSRELAHPLNPENCNAWVLSSMCRELVRGYGPFHEPFAYARGGHVCGVRKTVKTEEEELECTYRNRIKVRNVPRSRTPFAGREYGRNPAKDKTMAERMRRRMNRMLRHANTIFFTFTLHFRLLLFILCDDGDLLVTSVRITPSEEHNSY